MKAYPVCYNKRTLIYSKHTVHVTNTYLRDNGARRPQQTESPRVTVSIYVYLSVILFNCAERWSLLEEPVFTNRNVMTDYKSHFNGSHKGRFWCPTHNRTLYFRSCFLSAPTKDPQRVLVWSVECLKRTPGKVWAFAVHLKGSNWQIKPIKIWEHRTFSLNRYKHFTEKEIKSSSKLHRSSLLLATSINVKSIKDVASFSPLRWAPSQGNTGQQHTPPIQYSCLLSSRSRLAEVATCIRTISNSCLHITVNYFAGHCFDCGCCAPSVRQGKSLTEHISNYCKSNGNDCQKLHLTVVYKNPNRGTTLF